MSFAKIDRRVFLVGDVTFKITHFRISRDRFIGYGPSEDKFEVILNIYVFTSFPASYINVETNVAGRKFLATIDSTE